MFLITEKTNLITKKVFFWRLCLLIFWITELAFFFNEGQETSFFNLRLCFLNFLVVPPIVLSLFQKKFLFKKDFLIILPLFAITWFLFSSYSIFFFFIFYEISALPILIMVIQGGSGRKREEAGFFMLGYSIFSATSMLWRLFFFSKQGIVSSFDWFNCNHSIPWIGGIVNKKNTEERSLFLIEDLILFLSVITFFVKFPVFFIHVWLPKAHVEAPVYGSMILARILLKIRGSAIFLLFPKIDLSFDFFIIFLMYFCFYGGRIIGIVCFNQKDSKILIALSRVQHMSMSILGLLMMNSFALRACLMIMIGHGLVSPLLFFLRRVSYGKRRTRSFFLFDSTNQYSLIRIIIWTSAVFIRMGFPPFIMFEGEVLISKIFLWTLDSYVLYFSIFFSGMYSISLLSSSISKKENSKNKNKK